MSEMDQRMQCADYRFIFILFLQKYFKSTFNLKRFIRCWGLIGIAALFHLYGSLVLLQRLDETFENCLKAPPLSLLN